MDVQKYDLHMELLATAIKEAESKHYRMEDYRILCDRYHAEAKELKSLNDELKREVKELETFEEKHYCEIQNLKATVSNLKGDLAEANDRIADLEQNQ